MKFLRLHTWWNKIILALWLIGPRRISSSSSIWNAHIDVSCVIHFIMELLQFNWTEKARVMDVCKSFLVACDNLDTLPLCHIFRLMAGKELILLPTPSFHRNSSVLQPFSLTRTEKHWQSRIKAITHVLELFFCNPLLFFCLSLESFRHPNFQREHKICFFYILHILCSPSRFFPCWTVFSHVTVYQYLIS